MASGAGRRSNGRSSGRGRGEAASRNGAAAGRRSARPGRPARAARSARAPRPERAERARQILASARAVFSEKGYERASMAEIARGVGVVEGALYKHFASKRELLFAVIREMYEGLVGQLREGLGGIEGGRNRLRFAIWSQLRAFTEEAGLCRVVISEIRPLDDYGQSLVRQLNRELTGFAMRVLEEAIASGEFASISRRSSCAT